MINGRPGSMSEMMAELKKWMDTTDRLTVTLADHIGVDRYLSGVECHPGKGIQEDLLALAKWFNDNPRTSKRIYDEVFGG